MRGHTKRALAALLCLAPAAVAWTTVSNRLAMQPQSRLWINGSSTMRSFECKAASFDANVESTGPGAVSAVLAGEKAVRGVEFKVPANRLDCGNGTMNEHMLKALKAKDHPEIVFRLASYETAKAAQGVEGSVTGTLTIGGVAKTITMSGTATEPEPGTLRVKGSHEIRMKEYGLKPPTLMLGTLKVDERVKVSFDLLLKD
jgi:polyisoprenoid-binding protein YceI